MEQALLDAFKSSPALVALVVIVYLFIRAQAGLSKTFAETAKTMHDEHIEARLRDHVVSDKASAANIELARVMGEVKTALQECAMAHRENHGRSAS